VRLSSRGPDTPTCLLVILDFLVELAVEFRHHGALDCRRAYSAQGVYAHALAAALQLISEGGDFVVEVLRMEGQDDVAREEKEEEEEEEEEEEVAVRGLDDMKNMRVVLGAHLRAGACYTRLLPEHYILRKHALLGYYVHIFEQFVDEITRHKAGVPVDCIIGGTVDD
jgi:hypothetical protein